MRQLKLWFLILLLSATATAQVAEFAVTGGQSRLSNNGIGSFSATAGAKSDDLQLQDGFRLGFRMTFNAGRFFGHEVGYAYNRTQWRDNTSSPATETGSAIHQGFYNYLVYAMPEGSTVRPFAAGGVHFSNFVWPGYSVSSGGGSNKFGVNYGGGLKVRVSRIFAIRFDVREYRNGKPFDLPQQKGWIRQLEIGTGFALVL